MISSDKLKDGEFYWLNATAIDDYNSLMIGQYYVSMNSRKWYIHGQFYTAGVGIDPIKYIPKPRKNLK